MPPAAPTPVRNRAERWLLATSVILIAFNLRPVLASVPVLLPEIVAGTGLGSVGASYLTSTSAGFVLWRAGAGGGLVWLGCGGGRRC